MASFVFLLLWLLFLQSAAASDLISVKSGDNVTLPCQADGGSIRAAEWTRTDLKSEYVFIYRDGRSDQTNQHSYFKSRVQLKESKLKDGDVSLILKNVSMNDRGTYECRVATGSSKLGKEPIRSFTLEVTDSGGDDKFTGLAAAVNAPKTGVVVAVVGLLFVVVGLVVWSCKRCREQKSNPPAVDESANNDLLTDH